MSEFAMGDPRRLDVDAIVAAARAETGLTDIGEPDIIPPMRVLMKSYIDDAHFTPMGVEAQRAGLIRVVANRMRIEEQFQQHPEIAREEIIGPIVITGLPRSGTTKLLRMMAASPDVQKLLLWRILHPAPIGPTPPGGRDPRIDFAEGLSQFMRENHPDFYAGHPMNAFDPDEEEWLLDMVMLGYVNCHQARTPSWEAWMDRQNFDTWHPYLRKLMQLMQWQDGSPKKPWLIKAPSHLRHLPLLFRAFPNATIVHCHRDPVTTSVSLAALIEAIRRMYSDYADPHETLEFTYQHWAKQMAGYMRDRPALEKQHPFIDVSYKELTGDLMPTIRRIYDAARLELSDTAEKAMSDWQANNPQNKHGQHKYTLDRFGIGAEEIRAAFGEYLDRFGALV